MGISVGSDVSVGSNIEVTTSRMRIAIAAVLASFLLAMVIGISGLIAKGGSAALGASTTLTVLGGDVQVSRQGSPFEAATDGAIVSPGDIIRTAADSRAVLTYFEGSTVTIEPSSELAIDQAHASPDGSTVVVMTQSLGRTWHLVTRLITGGSKYEVRTPAATASVRGTAFEVGVVQEANGETTTQIVTAEGAVAAAAPATAAEPQPEPVVVSAGFETTAKSSERKLAIPTRAREPLRTVTVDVSDENSLVVDTFGRANGFKDGKLILQTPGAKVLRANGRLTIILPNLPDGTVATVVGQSASERRAGSTGRSERTKDVDVTTTVEERGKAPARVTDTVRAGERVTGVEVKHGGTSPDSTPSVRRVTDDERKQLRTPKTVVAPDRDDEHEEPVFRPGLGADPMVLRKIVDDRRAQADERPVARRPSKDTDERDSTEPATARGYVPQVSFEGAPQGKSRQSVRERLEREQRQKSARQGDTGNHSR